jgi:hypothetical protein
MNYPLPEQKLIYRVLHSSLMDHTELMDSQFLHDLQRSLQRAAQEEGVDVADHGAWDRWLGNVPVACEVRVEKRRTINSLPDAPSRN